MKHQRETTPLNPSTGISGTLGPRARTSIPVARRTLTRPLDRGTSVAVAEAAAGFDDEASYPSAGTRLASRPRALALSSLIARDLHLMGAREQHRRQMLTMLLLAHTLLAVAVAIGYVFPRPTPLALGALSAVLLIYLAVGAANLVFRRLALAIYLLVLGNGAIVTVLVGGTALAGQPFNVAQLALLYLAVVAEAGLLFTPEIVLILAGVTSTLSAAALLFAISLAPPSSTSQTYLLVVFTLTLQALVGLLAWYAADFIAETIQEVRRASQAEYAQTRLDALLAQHQRQQQELDRGIIAIQTAIARALAQDPNARVDLDHGRLADLARSVNLMLQRVEEGHRLAQERARMLAATGSVADAVGRLADGGTTGAQSRQRTPMTYTPIDNISIAAAQAQAQQQARQVHIQRLTAEAATLADESRGELQGALKATDNVQATVGKLLSAAETLLTTIHRSLDLSARGRHALAGLVPPEVLAEAPIPPLTPHAATEGVDLSGLSADIFRPGETAEFPAVSEVDPADPGDAGIGKMTRLLPALEPADVGKSPEEATAEVWRLLSQLGSTASGDERAAATMKYELGLVNSDMREAATKLARVLQALETLRSHAAQIEHVATTNEPLPDAPIEDRATMAPSARPPARSRPLAMDPGASLPVEMPDEAAGSAPEPGTMSAADLLSPLTGEHTSADGEAGAS